MFNLFKRKPEPEPEPKPKPPEYVSSYSDALDAERNKVKCEIDFVAAKAAGFVALSVERVHIGNIDEYTVIGFIEEQSSPPTTHEWTLHCSREQHNKIASQLSANTKGAPTKK